jgi:putative membrane protein
MTDTSFFSNTPRFEVRATADSHFGWLRTRLSIERTMMSSLRTAVSLIGFGFAIVQFFERLHEMSGVRPAAAPTAPKYLGLSLIASGILVLIVSVWYYRRSVSYLWSESFSAIAAVDRQHPMRSPLLAIAVVLMGVGLFALFAVVLRLV